MPDLAVRATPSSRRSGARFEPGRATRILLLACAAMLAYSAAQVLAPGPARAAFAANPGGWGSDGGSP